MQAVPGTLQTGGAAFASTRWSVVAACDANGDLSSPEAEAAVAQLCRDYWPPLYSFVRRRGFSPADAQDLVQGFFTHFLQDKIYARTDSARGKFRTFLLASLKNYIVDIWHREHTLKRGGGREFVVLDSEVGAVEKLYQDETVAILEEERHYEQRWATALVTPRACLDVPRLIGDCVACSSARFGHVEACPSGGICSRSSVELFWRLSLYSSYSCDSLH